MLQLVRKQLGTHPAGEAGVRVWWHREDGKKPQCCIAWPDLVVVGAKLRFPEDCHPEHVEGWKEAGTRIVWVPGLADYVFTSRAPVPNITPCLRLKPSDGKKLSRVPHVWPRWRVGDSKRVVYWSRDMQFRVELSVERKLNDLAMRLVNPPWAKGELMVMCYLNGKLRAVAKPEGIDNGERLRDSVRASQ